MVWLLEATATVGEWYLRRQYLVSDLDKEDEDDDNKQVVEDTNNANGGVDDLEYQVTHREHIRRDVIFQQGRCAVVQDITRQRWVLHRCRALSQSPASATL